MAWERRAAALAWLAWCAGCGASNSSSGPGTGEEGGTLSGGSSSGNGSSGVGSSSSGGSGASSSSGSSGSGTSSSGGVTSPDGGYGSSGDGGACTGSLSSRVRITAVDLGIAYQYNEVDNNGAGLGLTPLAISPIPGGGSRLAFLGTDSMVHIATLDASDQLVGVPFGLPAYDFQDIYA